MNSFERAEALARACSEFPWLGISGASTLLEWLKWELGSESALETGIQTPFGRSFPQPPASTLHVVSGNTPHAALQSLVRGLLLGGRHFVKIPTGGLAEVGDFLGLLPLELSSQVTFGETLEKAWLERADLVVAFGSDETLAQFRSKLRPDQAWIGHGHKLGCGFVFGPWLETALVLKAASDTAAFDQMGCLSPIAFFVEVLPESFAAELAVAFEKIVPDFPRLPLSSSAAASVAAARKEWIFRQQTEENCRIWASSGNTNWSVVLDESEDFPRTPLHRFIVVKPMPPELISYFAGHRTHLSCAGIDKAGKERIPELIQAGFQRVCPIGAIQNPSPFWHHDGFQPLAGRVRWTDVEFG